MDTNRQVRVAVRLPVPVRKRIERLAKEKGSTLSQFVRTACIEMLNRKEA